MFSQTESPPIPKYFELASRLRAQVEQGQLRPGEQIPSEPRLCETYGLSRGTVRQAIQLLENEGLLVREQGRGTFVARPAQTSHQFSLSSFDDEMRRQNRQPSTRLLTGEVIPCPPAAAARLALAEGTPVFHIRRLRLADREPAAVESRLLAQALCPHLAEEDLEIASLHWLFVQKYRIPLVRMEHVVEIQPVTPEEAARLEIEPATPAFQVDRLTFTTDHAGQKVPAVLFQAVYRQDQVAIQTHSL